MDAGAERVAVGKLVFALFLAVPFAALVWGWIAGERPIGARPAVIVTPVDAAWYSALPRDAAAATSAYLARVPAQTRERANAFATKGQWALALRIVVLVASTWLLMSSGLAIRMRDIAYRLSDRRWPQDVAFGLLLLAALLLLELPVDVFQGFVRWRQAGLAHAGFAQWLGDFLIQWGVISVFNVVGLVAIMALIRRRPTTWMLWSTLVYVALFATYVVVSPLYIEPLLNHYTPLPAGPARDAVLSLARANGVPADEVYVKDASRQSVLLNAQVTGIGATSRITLDDNTIASTPGSEIEFVMAHEIGHYVLRHIGKSIVFSGLVMGVGFLLIAWALRRLIGWKGRGWGVVDAGDVAALPLLWLLFSRWGYLALPIDNSISREQESEADLFGLNASGEPLGLAEFMLRDADAQPLEPSAFVEWAFRSHPSAEHRIAMAMRWRAEHIAPGDSPTSSSRVP